MNGFFTGNFIKKIKFYSTDQRNVSMYFYFQPANWNWNLDQVGQYLQFSNQYQSDQDWFGWIKGSDSSWMVFIGIQFQQCYLIMKTIAKVKKKKKLHKDHQYVKICRSESAVGFPKSPQNYIKTKKIWSILKFNFGIEHGINSNKNVLTSQIW